MIKKKDFVLMSKKGLFFVLSVLKRKRSSRVLVRSLYILLCFSCYGNENSKPSQKNIYTVNIRTSSITQNTTQKQYVENKVGMVIL